MANAQRSVQSRALPCVTYRARASRSRAVRAHSTQAREIKAGYVKEGAPPEVAITQSVDAASNGAAEGSASTRLGPNRTKIICTIGPATSSREQLLKLAKKGMDVARLNMTHGDHAWHAAVIESIHELNDQGFNIAVMVDTEGSEAHLTARDPVKVQAGQKVIFSIRPEPDEADTHHFVVSYEAFVDDVEPDDFVMVDGGMVIVKVKGIEGPDVVGEVIEPGTILSRANLTLRRHRQLVRGSSALLPVITAKDWQDIDFAVEHKVDFLAVSFVRNASVITNVQSYVKSQLERRHPEHHMDVFAKMEAYESVAAMPEIIAASDGIMVARSDLGAQIPLEDVPAVQKEIVFRCRQMGKPVIVASQLLNSMIDVPVPTRAEVADCADAVRQQADALMLSGETAAGSNPLKCVQTLRNVCIEVEGWQRLGKMGTMKYPKLMQNGKERMQEELCTSAAILATNLDAKAIFVFTRTGLTASLLSRRRPDCPIIALTDSPSVMRRLGIRWGVHPFRVELGSDPERNIREAFRKMADEKVLSDNDLIVCVSDVHSGGEIVRSVQLRTFDA